MTCIQIDDFDKEITTNYDAFGNVVREEERWVPRADEPIILSPPGTCEGEVSFEYRFDGLEPVADDNLPHVTVWSYDPRQGCGLSQEPLGFEAGETNLYRYHVPAAGDSVVEGVQYNEARHFDPSVGRSLDEER